MRPERRNTISADADGHRRHDGRYISSPLSCSRPPRPSSSTSSSSTSQLPVRLRVEGQPPAQLRAHPYLDLLHKYGHDYKVIFVGTPHEPLRDTAAGRLDRVLQREPGAAWIKRVTDVYASASGSIRAEEIWSYRQSIAVIKELMNGVCTHHARRPRARNASTSE